MTTFTIAVQTQQAIDFTTGSFFPFSVLTGGSISGKTTTSFAVTGLSADLVVKGSGFTYGGSGGPNGGTVTEIDENVHGSTTPIAVLTTAGIAITALLQGIGAEHQGIAGAYQNWSYTFAGGNGGDSFGTFHNAVADKLTGGNGTDNLYGNDGNDTLSGLAGHDVLFGQGGDDKLSGGADNDFLSGGPGKDVLDGGAGGHDIASYFSSATIGTPSSVLNPGPITVDLADPSKNTGDATGDTFIGIEAIEGTSGNDTLIGAANTTSFLIGGAGADKLESGGAAFTFADYSLSRSNTGMSVTDAPVTVNLANPGANTGDAVGDTYIGINGLMGGDGNDHLTGNTANNVLEGGGGADVLNGGAGTDVASYFSALTGVHASLAKPGSNTGDAKGDQYISIENLQGSNFDDVLTGNGQANILTGRSGADHLIGGKGFDFASYNDPGNLAGVHASLATPATNTGDAKGDTYVSIEGLAGSAHNDVLVGNAGDNRLNGELGKDKLTGGAGHDGFVFNTALSKANLDTVTDFVHGQDAILLDHTIFAGVGAVGTLNANAFFEGTAAHDASDRIVYNHTTGALYFDRDGTGAHAPVEFAVLANHPAILTAADFHII